MGVIGGITTMNKVRVYIKLKVESENYETARAMLDAQVEAESNRLGLIVGGEHDGNPYSFMMEGGQEVTIPVRNSAIVVGRLYEAGLIKGFQASITSERNVANFQFSEREFSFALEQLLAAMEANEEERRVFVEKTRSLEAAVGKYQTELASLCDAVGAADELVGEALERFLAKKAPFSILKSLHDRLAALLDKD
jgi:hypothetical protein